MHRAKNTFISVNHIHIVYALCYCQLYYFSHSNSYNANAQPDILFSFVHFLLDCGGMNCLYFLKVALQRIPTYEIHVTLAFHIGPTPTGVYRESVIDDSI